MKNIKKTKHCQILELNGKGKLSFHLYLDEEQKARITRYKLLCLNNEAEDKAVEASDETGHKFRILLNEKQARAVVEYQEQEETLGSLTPKPVQKICQGIVALVWKEQRIAHTIHFLWIDCRNAICKNISIDVFGYDMKVARLILEPVFAVMSQGIPQISNALSLDLKSEKKLLERAGTDGTEGTENCKNI